MIILKTAFCTGNNINPLIKRLTCHESSISRFTQKNPRRAIDFYARVFDWKFDKSPGQQDYWPVTTGPDDKPGINGGLIQRRAPIIGDAVIACVCTIETPSVDEYVAKAISSGGQNVLPKMAIPGVGWLAYCKDTEGNIFGVMHNVPSAK